MNFVWANTDSARLEGTSDETSFIRRTKSRLCVTIPFWKEPHHIESVLRFKRMPDGGSSLNTSLDFVMGGGHIIQPSLAVPDHIRMRRRSLRAITQTER